MPERSDKLSPSQYEILRVALRALETEKGICVSFDAAELGSLDGCKAEAIRFRNNYNNMKAKARREGSDMFDGLGCYLKQHASGWTVRLVKAVNAFGPFKVTDIATGEPINVA